MSNNREEHLKYVWEQVDKWLSFAEAKNAGLIAFNIALISIIVEKIINSDAIKNGIICDKAICLVAMILLVASMLLNLYSFLPDLTSSLKKKQNSSIKELNLLFFSDIAQLNSKSDFLEMTDRKYFNKDDIDNKFSELEEDLASEILINSKITNRKYKLFRKSVWLDVLGIILLAYIVVKFFVIQ